MEPKVFSNRSALAGSAARDAEAGRARKGARPGGLFDAPPEAGAQTRFQTQSQTRSESRTSSFRIRPGSAAPMAEAAKAEVAHNGGGMGFHLRAGGQRATPARLFPGPSGRPLLMAEPASGPVQDPVSSPVPEPAPAMAAPPIFSQQAPYPDGPQPGTATSIGARFKHAFQSFFT